MWVNVSFIIDAAQADTVCDYLLEQGACSVSWEDADAGTPAEQAQFDEPDTTTAPHAWQRTRVIALFNADIWGKAKPAEQLHCWITQALGLSKYPQQIEFTLTPVESTDWVRATQAQFKPIHISDRLWILPSWHDPPADAQGIVHLDPGLAFGTGSHPTTRLCLDWLSEHIRGTERVLDYGCGSGILGIAAARLGARQVTAVDLDPNALSACEDNAHKNKVALRVMSVDQFAQTAHSPYKADLRFDCIVANILAAPLCLLAPVLSARLAKGGHLVLSGILVEQSEQLIAAYQPWVSMHIHAIQDGWVCLEACLGEKNPSTIGKKEDLC
jgi:ribosomal protein L11 methyltransferase